MRNHIYGLVCASALCAMGYGTACADDTFVTIRNDSSVVLSEVYFGPFTSWDDLLRGAPNALADGPLQTGESVYTEIFVDSCLTNMIVTTENNTVLVQGVGACSDEIVITDDDVLLDD